MQTNQQLLRRLERQFIRRHCQALGLQMPEYWLLHLLDSDGLLRQEDIVFRTSMDKAAVARILARLEERGLVRRQISPQCRREKLVGLTADGEAMALRIQETLLHWETICFQGFSPEEQSAYEAFLLRVIDNAINWK